MKKRIQKQILLCLLSTILLSVISYGQSSFEKSGISEDQAKKKGEHCVTASCCSFFIFTVDIWHETTCHSFTLSKGTANPNDSYSISFQSKEPVNQVEVAEDVLLAGMYNENGENQILPKGVYKVENNQFNFTPLSAKMPTLCYIRHVFGSLLGFDYDYEIKVCVTFILLKSVPGNGTVSINLNLSEEQLSELKNKGNKITFKEETAIREDGIDFIIPAGDYDVNDDGSIYFQNVKVTE